MCVCVRVLLCVCVCGPGAVMPALLTRSENPNKTLFFGLILSLVSEICCSSENTHRHTHTRAHTNAKMVAFGRRYAGVSRRVVH